MGYFDVYYIEQLEMTHGLPVNLSGNLRLAMVGRPAKND
jgi:hypothetical protein